jgi:addiction module RelE/StbE family toxin
MMCAFSTTPRYRNGVRCRSQVEVLESKAARKTLDKAPDEIGRKYDLWLSIIESSGPEGLRQIKGFRDEALSGNWDGHRSSRLNQRYRVIYRVQRDDQLVMVEGVTPHDYRR